MLNILLGYDDRPRCAKSDLFCTECVQNAAALKDTFPKNEIVKPKVPIPGHTQGQNQDMVRSNFNSN